MFKTAEDVRAIYAIAGFQKAANQKVQDLIHRIKSTPTGPSASTLADNRARFAKVIAAVKARKGRSGAKILRTPSAIHRAENTAEVLTRAGKAAVTMPLDFLKKSAGARGYALSAHTA